MIKHDAIFTLIPAGDKIIHKCKICEWACADTDLNKALAAHESFVKYAIAADRNKYEVFERQLNLLTYEELQIYSSLMFDALSRRGPGEKE